MKTKAEMFADALDNDGQNFETTAGQSFDELAESMGAKKIYATRAYTQAGDWRYVPGYRGEWFAGDPVRYQFDDESAVVLAGDGWDVEGKDPFSWQGA